MFSEAQIVQFSTDPGSLVSGDRLARAVLWQQLGQSERGIWGEIAGSGKTPYQVAIDFSGPAWKCSCPSKKFPCEYSLGLLLTQARDPQAFARTPEPDWVRDWLDKRAGKAAAAPKTADKSKAKDKRQQERHLKMLGGIAEMERWLLDLLNGGLLALRDKKPADWQKLLARMTDAQLPGMAALIRELQALPYTEEQRWLSPAMSLIARMWLLVQAYPQLTDFQDNQQDDLKTVAGISITQKTLLETPDTTGISDTWLVLSRQTTQEDDLVVQRNWLYGFRSKQHALLLFFAHRSAPPIQNPLLPRMYAEGELVFYPGSAPLRAIFRQYQVIQPEPDPLPDGYSDWESAHQHTAQVLARFPWADRIPLILANALLVPDGQRWLVADARHTTMPLHPSVTPDQILKTLAITGGKPADMALLRMDEWVVPLGVWTEGRYFCC